MPRPTDTDGLNAVIIARHAALLGTLTGWGTFSDLSPAIYPTLDTPMPQEPFPCAYVYFEDETHDYLGGTGYRCDVTTTMTRILGGPVTPHYQFNPEQKVYEMLKGVVNVYSYFRYLEDPLTNEPMKLDPEYKLSVGTIGKIRYFNYKDLGLFAGIEVPTTVGFKIHVGRNS